MDEKLRSILDSFEHNTEALLARMPDFTEYNNALSSNNNVQADNEIKKLLLKHPKNLTVQNNYAYNLIRTGEAEEARQIFLSIINSNPSIDLLYTVISNYMMCCDYCGIPVSQRIDITKFYPKPQSCNEKQ